MRSFVRTLILALAVFSLAVAARAEIVRSGTFEGGGAWEMDEHGVMTVSGPADMEGFRANGTPLQDALTKVVYGPEVEYIDTGMFSYCYELTEFSVDPDNPYYASVDGVVYDKDLTTVIECPTGKAGELTLPDTVEVVSDDAFIGSALSLVNLPEGLRRIGDQAFWGSCLTEITLPSTANLVESNCFNVCDELENIYVGLLNDSYTSEGGVLYSADGATLFHFPGGRGGDYSAPEGTTAIGSCAFYYAWKLTSVTLPEGLETIEGSAFVGCGMSEINLPASLTEIKYGAFNSCDRLETINFAGTTAQWAEVDIENDNTPLQMGVIHCQDGDVVPGPISGDIGWNDAVVTYTLTPEGLLTISGAGEWDFYAFSDDNSIVKAVLEPGVTEVGWGGFFWAESLAEVVIPDSVTVVGGYSFYGCKSLKTLTLPAAVTTIGEEALLCTESLTDIYFGGTMEAWRAMTGGADEVYNAEAVTVHCQDGVIKATDGPVIEPEDFYLPDDLTEIGDEAFMGIGARYVAIPYGCTSIGDRAFMNCENLLVIDIPDTVTDIGEDAFANCPNLVIETPYDSPAAQYARENSIDLEEYGE